MGASHLLRRLPERGARFINAQIASHGGSEKLINLGQGQPEPLPAELYPKLILDRSDLPYGPFEGLLETREAIAEFYNTRYRKGLTPITSDQVMVAPGGRAALARVLHSLALDCVGLISPDYMGFEDLVTMTNGARIHRIEGTCDSLFAFPHERVLDSLEQGSWELLLMSNPCNPTGRVVPAAQLVELISASSARGAILAIDEFYSQYSWGPTPYRSALSLIPDIETASTVIVDGVTKNFRAPGLRLAWAIGPRELVACMRDIGSIVDGGTSRPIQRMAATMLQNDYADRMFAETAQLFTDKRQKFINALREIGFTRFIEPEGTFYVFASLEGTRAEGMSGIEFMRKLLQFHAVVLPGQLFDHSVHAGRPSPKAQLESWLRFSFGAPLDDLYRGFSRLEDCLGAIHQPSRPSCVVTNY